MKFSLRSLILTLTAFALVTGGLTSYYDWLDNWNISSTEFSLYFVDSKNIIYSRIEPVDNCFSLEEFGFPCRCFLETSNLASMNNGTAVGGGSSVELYLSVDENGSLMVDTFESEHLAPFPAYPHRVKHRIRMKYRQLISSGPDVAIETQAILEDYDGVSKVQTIDVAKLSLSN